jgi:2'-phosphotransferase
MADHDVHLSKTLAWVLRHEAKKAGLDMRADGFVPCAQVLSLLKNRCFLNVSQARLTAQVQACPKRRLELTPCGMFIRASRGHSIRNLDDTQILPRLVDADAIVDAVHEVRRTVWLTARTAGLRCNVRNHIHFATQKSTSGYVFKGGAENVHVYLDTAKAIADGVKLYLAGNGVVLTRGVGDTGVLPAVYFKRAVAVCNDGEVVDLAFGDACADAVTACPD